MEWIDWSCNENLEENSNCITFKKHVRTRSPTWIFIYLSLGVLNILVDFKGIIPQYLIDSAYSNLHLTVKGSKTEDSYLFPC